MDPKSQEICSFCHIGQITERNLTYTEWYQEELVTVPGVPARVCDYCGEKEFDPFVLGMLHRLLWFNTDSARETTAGARIRQRRLDLPAHQPKDPLPPSK